jgi:serine/threonine-protein kinase
MIRNGAGVAMNVGDEAGFPTRFVDENGHGYRAADEIGRGVLTNVYRAEPDDASIGATSITDGGQLVLKTVLPLWVGHPLAEARIAREREVARSIADGAGDARCARIVAAGRQAGHRAGQSRPFHVARRLLGATLAHRMMEGRVPSAVTLGWLDTLLRTLGCVHDAGWVHRDVKPQNLLIGGLTPNCIPEAWLIDFGLALPVGRARHDGDDAFGTPAYVSPEVIAGAPVDARADLYSVGLVAYELLTGSRPFCSRDPIALLDAHLSDTPPPLRALAPEVSPELERVITASLEKAPMERPATASELRHLLASCPEANPETNQAGRNSSVVTKEDCTVRTNG